MAIRHFLVLFPMAKAADFRNSLMEKIKSLDFVFVNTILSETTDPE